MSWLGVTSPVEQTYSATVHAPIWSLCDCLKVLLLLPHKSTSSTAANKPTEERSGAADDEILIGPGARLAR